MPESVATIYSWDDDMSGEGIAVHLDGEELVSVFTSWESPEDNSVTRLGLHHAITACLQARPDRIVHMEGDPEELLHPGSD